MTTAKVVQLADVARIVQGGRHGLSGNHFVPAGFPAYGAGGLNGLLASYEFDEPAVVLSSIGARCGKCFLATGRWSSLANTQVILPHASNADARFLWYQLNDERGWLRAGTAQPFIKPSTVKSRRVWLPDIEEQRRIAATLDKADAIRRKRKEAIGLTEELLRSTFLEMFGDPVTNPKGWPVRHIGEFLAFITSGSRGWAEHYATSGARFIRSMDVQMGFISEDDVALVQPPRNAEAERTRVRDWDVLLTITGSKIGRAAMVEKGFGEAYISQHVAILRTDGSVLPEFLTAFLCADLGGQRQIAQSQYGQTKPGLNLDQIRRFTVPFPPLPLQQQFIRALHRVRMMNVKMADAARETDALFDSLVHRAFRGDL